MTTPRSAEWHTLRQYILGQFITKVRFTVDEIYCSKEDIPDTLLYQVLDELEEEEVIQKVTRIYSEQDHATQVYCVFTTPGNDGYRPCFCRDCMETTIGPAGELCYECEEADCDPAEECLAPDAYGGQGIES